MTDRYEDARAELMKEIKLPEPQALLAHALLETVNWHEPADRSHLLPSELPRFRGRVHVGLAGCYAEVNKVYGLGRSTALRQHVDGIAEQVAVLLLTDNDRPAVVDGFTTGVVSAVDYLFGVEVAVVGSIG
jgi:hypothetical protein